MNDALIAQLEARVEAALAAPDDPVALIDATNALAWEVRHRDAGRANALARQARALAIEHDYKLGQARAMRTMGMTLREPEELRNVFHLAREAKSLFDEVGDAAGRAGSRDFLASLYEHIGELDAGLELALDALSIAREIEDPVRQGYALSSVGGILAASGQTDVAVDRLKEALVLFEGVGDQDGIGSICSRLSRVLKDAGEIDEALAYAARRREQADLHDPYLRWDVLSMMAEIEEQRGDLAEAERLYRAALASLEGEDSVIEVMGATTQVALGRLLIARGVLEEAEDVLKGALERVEDHAVSIVTEMDARDALAQLYERRGQLGAAIDHLRRSQALRERIAQQNARNKLAQVEVRAEMETAKKDAEIQRLRFVELHEMQSKLVEAEKMALLGKLAAGTAHELNTPLGALRSNADLVATATERLVSLLSGGGESSAQANKLAAVLESCKQTSDEALERIAAIARSFRRFTELDQAERREFDLRDGLESALALLEPTLRDEIKLERRLAAVPKIVGWPREVNYAMMTVLQNAAQAIDGPGLVVAQTSATEREVLVLVRDNGRGMSQPQVDHLFDVAWTDDGPRTRMRLGLSAAYSTMQKHGGTIEVESALGQGTSVSFRFPRQ